MAVTTFKNNIIKKHPGKYSISLPILGFLSILIIGIIDFYTGFKFSLAIFYIVPIVFIARVTPRPWGIVAAAASFFAWFLADFLARNTYPNQYIHIWNCASRLLFFIIIAFLERKRQDAFNRVSELASIDSLTGISNLRSFLKTAEFETEHSKRYKRPLSLAYFDLDNFKKVNDEEGHHAGDKVLKTIAETVSKNLRSSDLPARIGGDEFVILMPDTDMSGAEIVMKKIQTLIADKMQECNWPVTVSIGIAASNEPVSAQEMLSKADTLMYEAKNSGKNKICLKSF